MDKRTIQLVALLVSTVLFVLAGLVSGGHISGLDGHELADFGLAALTIGVLAPAV